MIWLVAARGWSFTWSQTPSACLRRQGATDDVDSRSLGGTVRWILECLEFMTARGEVRA